MKTLLAIILLTIAAPAIAHAQATIPPPTGPQVTATGPQSASGCGSPKEEWDVTTDEKNHPTAAAETAKAHLYFIQDDAQYIPHPRPTTRFGVDGEWAGATHSNSYFFAAVDPGEHRVCVSRQGMNGAGGARRESSLDFTAEAGTDYYFSARDIFSGPPNPGPPPIVVFRQINSDEALGLMSKFAFATSTPKK
ncbi:MAG: DUF2846 domain-containing protein [Candidatus Acidiferrales bacterium]